MSRAPVLVDRASVARSADLLSLLQVPARLELLVLLGTCGEASVGELVVATGESQPAVSRHLRLLREAGLVTARTSKKHHLYRLEPAVRLTATKDAGVSLSVVCERQIELTLRYGSLSDGDDLIRRDGVGRGGAVGP